jgi:hypothetical protein
MLTMLIIKMISMMLITLIINCIENIKLRLL